MEEVLEDGDVMLAVSRVKLLGFEESRGKVAALMVTQQLQSRDRNVREENIVAF